MTILREMLPFKHFCQILQRELNEISKHAKSVHVSVNLVQFNCICVQNVYSFILHFIYHLSVYVVLFILSHTLRHTSRLNQYGTHLCSVHDIYYIGWHS